jgi:hypothetical protein
MAALRRVLLALLVAGLVALGTFGAWLAFRWSGLGARMRVYSTPTLLREVQTLSQLVTVQYIIEKVEILEVPSQNLIGQAIGSENRVLMVCHGVVKAGIDFGELQPDDLRVNGSTITVRLPPARITDAYLDERQTKVIDRKTGLLAPSDKDLEQTARQNAVEDIRRAARNGGILKDAEERAQFQLRNLFHQMGYERVEFKSP